MKKKISVLLGLVAFVLFSCSKEYEVQPSVNRIILTADRSTRTVGEAITFSVVNNFGEDFTDEAEIYVDGELLSSNVYTSDEIGSHNVVAKYFSVNSDAVQVRFHDGSETNFTKRVLIEDYTGTWCGYCPRVAYAIELLHNLTDAYVPVAIHRVSNNPTDPTYDPYNFDSTVLENQINVPGYPKGMLNRTTQWRYPEPDYLSDPIGFTQGESKIGLAMSSMVSGGNISLTVNGKFANAYSNLKLVVYVLENGLVHDQYNYTTYYGGLDPIPNYVHNHTLRAPLTSLMGDAVPSSETGLNQIYSRTFNVPVPTNVANAANLEFVAFFIDASGAAVNARKSAPGEEQEFEEF